MVFNCLSCLVHLLYYRGICLQTIVFSYVFIFKDLVIPLMVTKALFLHFFLFSVDLLFVVCFLTSEGGTEEEYNVEGGHFYDC